MNSPEIVNVRLSPNPVEAKKEFLIAVSVIDVQEVVTKLHYAGDEYYSGQPIELML